MNCALHRVAASAVAVGLAFGITASLASARTAAVGVESGHTSSDAATWKPWHLSAADQFRLPAPPAARSATTKSELKEILRAEAKSTAKMRAVVKKWNAQPAISSWSDIFIDSMKSYRPRPPAAGYNLALYYTGLYDAMIAARDSRDAYVGARPAPSKLDRRIKIALKISGSSYAPEEAAMAGAAETLLAYLFLDAPPALYHAAALDAINARVWGGLNYRSDVTRARALGQQVAQLVIAQAKDDGRLTATGFPFPVRTGEPYWVPTAPAFEPPFGGPAGIWRPWLMTSNDQFLHALPGPSKYGTAAYMEQLKAVLDTVNNSTQEQKRVAFFWDDGPGTVTPPGHWVSIAEGLVKQYHIANDRATRMMAYLGAALADAGVEAWRIKYFYWSVRPITAIWRLCDGGATLCTEAQVAADPGRATYRGRWYSPIRRSWIRL